MKAIHIKRIIIRGFKGFKTKSIEVADITMIKKLQQLISTNGSGKSTFLRELSISPINKELYRKDGSKEVYFEVDGEDYIAILGHKVNILKDGNRKTLTNGGTITQYNETIRTMFGYTDYKWRLITGQLKFSKLTKGERQKWIETISGIDFDYPFKVYAAIRGRITGVKRAIKEYEAELSNGEDKVLSDELLLSMTERKSELGEHINAILSETQSIDAIELNNAMVNYKELNVRLGEAKRTILYSENKSFGHLNINSLEEFRESYLKDGVELDKIDVEFKHKEKELRDKVELRNKLNTGVVFDMDAAKSMLRKEEGDLEELEDMTKDGFMDIYEGHLKDLAIRRDDILEAVKIEIMGISTGDASITHTLTAKERVEANNVFGTLSSTIRGLNETISHTDELITETMSGKDITCPECKAQFKDGQYALAGLKIKKNDAEDKLARCKIQHDRSKEMLDGVAEIDSMITRIKVILDKHVTVHHVRHALDKYLDGTGSINDIIETLDYKLEMARNSYRIITTRKTIADINSNISYNENLAKLGSVEDFTNQCDSIENELIEIRTRRNELKKLIEIKRNDGRALAKYVKSLDELDNLIKEHGDALSTFKTMLYQATMRRIMDGMQTEMSDTVSKITNNAVVSGIRSKLQIMITDSVEELKVLTELEKAINPATGIIAEQLINYCNIFSKFTTQILNNIWGYNLEVLNPIVNPTTGLNYRFPMSVVDDEVISDISNGSTSQISIIDLAIVVASRELLDANNHLLIMDEVGAGFDTIHNVNLGEFMYDLINDSPSKNILVVHHDQTIRGMLGDCDTIVFDDSQVIVEDGYNENVVLK